MTVINILLMLTHSIFTITRKVGSVFNPHFAHEGTEAEAKRLA